MSDVVIAFFVPTVVFLVIVAPLWILMHYRSKQRARGELSAEERQLLELLAVRAERMGERIETLESILDDETPGWRAACRRRNTRRWGRERRIETMHRRTTTIPSFSARWIGSRRPCRASCPRRTSRSRTARRNSSTTRRNGSSANCADRRGQRDDEPRVAPTRSERVANAIAKRAGNGATVAGRRVGSRPRGTPGYRTAQSVSGHASPKDRRRLRRYRALLRRRSLGGARDGHHRL